MSENMIPRLTLEERVDVLEKGLGACHRQLDVVIGGQQVLLAEVKMVSTWIKERFGVQLVNKIKPEAETPVAVQKYKTHDSAKVNVEAFSAERGLQKTAIEMKRKSTMEYGAAPALQTFNKPHIIDKQNLNRVRRGRGRPRKELVPEPERPKPESGQSREAAAKFVVKVNTFPTPARKDFLKFQEPEIITSTYEVEESEELEQSKAVDPFKDLAPVDPLALGSRRKQILTTREMFCPIEVVSLKSERPVTDSVSSHLHSTKPTLKLSGASRSPRVEQFPIPQPAKIETQAQPKTNATKPIVFSSAPTASSIIKSAKNMAKMQVKQEKEQPTIKIEPEPLKMASSEFKTYTNVAKFVAEQEKLEKPKNNFKLFTCNRPNCHKTFLARSSLTYHERVHRGEKPHLCKVCNASFTRPIGLREHSKIHTGERPFMCEGCYVSYKYRYQRNNHRGICIALRKTSLKVGLKES